MMRFNKKNQKKTTPDQRNLGDCAKVSHYLREVDYILGKDRNKMLWLVPLFLFSSVLDLIGIGLVATFVTILINHKNLSEDFLQSILEKLGFINGENIKLVTALCCFLIILVFFSKMVTAIFVNKKIFRLCFNQTVNLRTHLMRSYQDMTYVEYLKRNSSEYVYNIQTVIGQFAISITQSILRIVSEGLICIVIIIFLVFKDWQSLSILMLMLVGAVFSYDKFFKNRIKNYGIKSNKYSTKMVRSIQEGMNGFRENRIFGITEYFNKRLSDNAKGLADIKVKSQAIMTSSQYVVEFILIVFVVLLVLVSVLTGRTIDSIITTIATFAVAAMRLMPSANQILSCATKVRYGRDMVDILYNDLKMIDENREKCEYKKTPARLIKYLNESELNKSDSEFKSLRLSNIEFIYPSNSRPTLSNISLEIEKGFSIGIIGTSGSGKTTLIDIILGLLIPNKGNIFYNYRPIEIGSNEWQSEFAYLPQDVFIIDDTLKRNIALGIMENQINKDKLLDSIKRARLEELVDRLPDGLNSSVGDRGMRLSGGQRQRIAIARAFYHDRNVLVMDESTSALDDQTEKEVIDEISHLKGTITLIVVAHRLTTLKNCDIIYEIESGKIVRKGDYESIVGSKRKVIYSIL